ncbi:MAG TPA: YggS family pyridoxal phosphate-dependent enzyme [Alphaproteobacteria bacterium]|nr:YggS family pyridoxal phosphate-dependent enzyme [Alphaproteobacteria bacterium]
MKEDKVITQHLRDIERRIAAAAKAAGRDPASIRLIAVSKGVEEEKVRSAIKAGQNVFGENRVQETKLKYVKLRPLHAPLELHLIGPLQTNKAEEAVRLFETIQTVDRPRLAEALSAAIRKIGRTPKLYAEVNIGQEAQKAGVVPNELEMFLKFCRDSCSLKIEGLMCIPPQGDDPEPYFKNMKILADRHKLPNLSMGMSADFETAIKCGATEVRVGTSLFGVRAGHVGEQDE